MMALDEKMLKWIKEGRVDDTFNMFFDDAFQKKLYVDVRSWRIHSQTTFLMSQPRFKMYSSALTYTTVINHSPGLPVYFLTSNTTPPSHCMEFLSFNAISSTTINLLKKSFVNQIASLVLKKPRIFYLNGGIGKCEIDIPNLDALLIMVDLKSIQK